MLDDRRTSILNAVVEQYVASSQPVSSSQVASAKGINASSATVRSEMASLERDGYLRQPHTSAGRVPTDQGYRLFVDQLGGPVKLGPVETRNVRTFFGAASSDIESMLHETGRLLSTLTGAAAVVVGPDHETTTVASAQIVVLSHRTALAVIVLSNGTVEKRSIELPDNTDESVVADASAQLAARLVGKSLSTPLKAVNTGNKAIDKLTSTVLLALQSGHSEEADNVFVGGTSLLASSFDAVEKVRNVLTILESHYVVVTLIRDLLDRGMSVSIGTEHNVEPLADCSLVVAPTFIEGEQRGSVAILGPTRMDYGQAMAAVSLVSRSLGERLSETGK